MRKDVASVDRISVWTILIDGGVECEGIAAIVQERE
jgi:hypothetical protein